MRQTWSNSLALSTKSSRVVGWGDTPIIFWCNGCGSAFLKANILVSSFAPDLEAWVDHSWYHSLKGRLPILDVYMALVASSFVCAGMKCFLKSARKVTHVPKLIGFAAKAVFCLSWAHSPAGVPSLKYVSAEETFLLASAYKVSLR